jgi:hypothetical protein
MKFKITVRRTGYSYQEIEVEADTKEEAEGKALSEAPDHDFTNEKDSEYELLDAPTKRNLGYFSESPVAKNPDSKRRVCNALGGDTGYQDCDGVAIVTVDDLDSAIESSDEIEDNEATVNALAELLGWANRNDITYINMGM